ncbi:MAG: tetratricopeptide repeat protein [Gemmatimonadota bacterium]|nr:tetratricopeptide repeat protein [Gemmatimonadota bacterium]
MTRASRPSPAEPGSGPPAGAAWAAPVVVFAAAVLAFVPTLQAGFVNWDDDRNFLDNAAYRGLGPAELRWMWTTFHMGHYVPLTWMTHGLDYVLWGMDPRGYHLVNLLLHAAAALAVYFLARRLLALALPQAEPGRVLVGAAATALLFAVHPLRAESVAWVTERRDVLSGLLYALTLIAYLRSAEPGGSRRWYWIALATFVAALLSKAVAMTAPAIILILNVYPLRRVTSWRDAFGAPGLPVWRDVAPFALLSAGTATLSLVALHPPTQLGVAGKAAVSAWSVAYYLGKTLLPTSLSPLHEMPKSVDPLATQFLAAYGVVALAVAAWVAARRRAPGAAAALAAWVVLLLPTLGVVQNGPQIVADRYTYHAAPALALIAGAALVAVPRAFDAVARSMAAVVIVAFGAATWRQATVWTSPETLWTRVLAVEPGSAIAEVGLASDLAARGRFADAAEHYKSAIAIDPTYPEAHNNLGVALTRIGNPGDAVPEFVRAIELKPDYAEAFSNWGNALVRLGDVPGAIGLYRRAVAADPAYADAQVNWGNALVRLDSAAAAIPHYEAALAIRPDNADAHLNWGVALARLGQFGDAAEQFRRALSLKPDLAEARDYLARVEAMGAPRPQ